MAALEPDYFEPNMLQTSKIVKWKIAWKKMDFADLVKDMPSQLQVLFSLLPISSRTE